MKIPSEASRTDSRNEQFRFGYLVHDVSRIRRTVMDQIMKPYGITRAQWSILTTLSRGGNNGMMQADLARLMDIGKVTIGGLVDRLEGTGHVERRPDPTDRRAKRVFLTDCGHEVVAVMISVASEANKRLLKGLTPEEVAIAEKVLLQTKFNLKEILEEEAAKVGATLVAAQ